MYIATVNRKEQTERGIQFFVDFTDGATVVTESVIPQDEDGLIYYVKARLDSLNSSKTLPTKFLDGAVIEVVKPVVPPTVDEAKVIAYQEARGGLIIAKQDLDLGLITQAEFLIQQATVIALKPIK